MKLALPNNVYIVRDSGEPVEGRMKVYLHDSDNYAEVFTLEGSDYVQAQNPQLLHAGLPEASLFTEVGLYDIVIEKYIGPEGSMSVDSPDTDFSMVDEFQWGLDFNPETYSTNRVDTIEDLKDVDPSLKMVTVLWYSTPGDCFPRTYLWDANALNEEDGGYVIASDVSDSGRWILMWGNEILPACVYGVKPSDTANMNLLLNYTATVGSFLLKTARGVRFLEGIYTGAASYTTNKVLYFDGGANFPNISFTCPSIQLLGPTGSYIADFVFTGKGVEAHSSWFKSVARFWGCGAQKLVIDKTDYFANTAINGAIISVSNSIVEGMGKRINATYDTGSALKFTNCTIVGQKIFNPLNDKLWFYGMEIKEEWFDNHQVYNYDFGQISQGHRLDIRTGQQNIVKFENFYTPNIYLKALLADPMVSVFDGHGASYGSNLLASHNKFTAINNVNYSGAIEDIKCDSWNNVVATSITFLGSGRSVNMTGCSFAIGGTTDSVTQLVLRDCVVSGGTLNPNSTALLMQGGEWRANIELSDSAKTNRTRNKTISFNKVSVLPTGYLWLNDITMVDCVSSAHIYLVPWNDSGYGITGTFERNRFVGTSLIEANVKEPSTDYGVYGVAVALRFLDNVWEQTGNGIYIPYRTLNFLNYFVSLGSAAMSLYKGNVGNCPLEKHDLEAFEASAMTNSYGSGSTAWHYLNASTNRRVWNLNPNVTWSVAFGNLYEKGSNPNPINGVGSAMYIDYLLHIGQTDYLEEHNDQFLVTHAWEEQQGYNAAKSVAVFQ